VFPGSTDKDLFHTSPQLFSLNAICGLANKRQVIAPTPGALSRNSTRFKRRLLLAVTSAFFVVDCSYSD